MTVKIAKSHLGLTGADYTVNFAWTDNVHDEGDYTKFSGDIMDFYISGDVAPGGRFKFSYISTPENSGLDVTEDTTAEETVPMEPATDTPVVEAPTEEGTHDVTEPEKKGCTSSASVSAVLLAACAAAVALGKKRDGE
jgi:hypothetical protein